MMFLKKDKILLYMKFFAALFLIFMMTKSVQFLINMNFENLDESTNNELKQLYDTEFCNKYWLFHIFAFVLGAFWNVKKLLKVGIV
jgi:hypothetical protein